MGGIIVALPKIQEAARIADVLRKNGLPPRDVCSHVCDALQAAHAAESGVVICTAQLKDGNYRELLADLPSFFDMILLSRNPDVGRESSQILRLPIPFTTSDLVNTAEMVLAQNERKIGRKKSTAAKRTPEEKKILEDAKKVLMLRNDMTEPESYRYIQKCSMDTGTGLLETARMILLLESYR